MYKYIQMQIYLDMESKEECICYGKKVKSAVADESRCTLTLVELKSSSPTGATEPQPPELLLLIS